MFFLRFVYRGIWLSGLLERRNLAANQIALSLASLCFIWEQCGCHDKVGNQKRTYGLCEIAARGSIFFYLLLETVFMLYFRFFQYLPQVFCKC
jgi:hypothetical protein